jgi:cbb3-type cytochrome oxidase subunit 3
MGTTKLALLILVFLFCGGVMMYQFQKRKKAEREERRAERETAKAFHKKKDTKFTRFYSP